MALVSDLERPAVSVAYVQILVELLAERGIPARKLFAGMPGMEARVADADARVTTLQMLALASRAIELTGDSSLGYSYGLRLRPTTHGFLGYAALSSSSLAEATEHIVRYSSIRSTHARVKVVDHDGDVLFVAEERTQLPMPSLRRTIHEALGIGSVRSLAVLLGRELEDLDGIELWFDMPEPDYHRAWASRLPKMRFDAGMSAIRVRRDYLHLRPVLADPFASKQAIARCEQELAALPTEDIQIVERVRAVIAGSDQGARLTIDEVAKQLAMSSRTLTRRLTEQGTTYLLLVNERRERQARELLLDTSLPVTEIALTLGYDPPNFTRAFLRWAGMTPTEFRERARRLSVDSR